MSNSVQNDTITLEFINPTTGEIIYTLVEVYGNNTSINNYTQINFEKDFFTPPNGLTMVIEDDRVFQIAGFIQRGYKVKISINGNPNMYAYIFDYNLRYNRSGGIQLSIQCKDLLEYMAQATMYPNMGNDSSVNFHFKPTDTLQFAITTIAGAFDAATQTGDIFVTTDNSGSLTFASGFRAGVGKKGKNQVKSINSALNHLMQGQKGESYLAYMLRICKHAGANIKMHDSLDNTIIIKAPTYDRENPSPFQITHFLTPPDNLQNNVLDAEIHFALDKQPSVVIVEANTIGDGKFYQGIMKGIAINELTAYDFVKYVANALSANDPNVAVDPIPAVRDAVALLTNGNLGTGYVLAPFNTKLFQHRADQVIDIDTRVSIPYYTVDYNAHTKEEAVFAASKLLAEQQDKYVEFKYRVQGWTMAGTNYVWQPDMMVNVYEEVFHPNNIAPFPIPMWIRKVNFLKSRTGGTETEITCTLPYTHNFEITP